MACLECFLKRKVRASSNGSNLLASKKAVRLSPDSFPQFFRLSAQLAMAQARPTSPETGDDDYLRRLECMVYLDEFESLMLDYANGNRFRTTPMNRWMRNLPYSHFRLLQMLDFILNLQKQNSLT